MDFTTTISTGSSMKPRPKHSDISSLLRLELGEISPNYGNKISYWSRLSRRHYLVGVICLVETYCVKENRPKLQAIYLLASRPSHCLAESTQL